VTQTSRLAWESNNLSLIICTVIGVIVFGAMAYAIFKFRKSKGAVAATFSHNTKAEIIWTVIPVIILIVMAWPATANLIKMYDTRDAEMTVKVTGYQWMWKYEYLGENVTFTSRLDRESDRVRQSGIVPTRESHPHYLLDVDNRLVLPVDTKVRFVITSDDVIHAWWVPALGWKQDAIPGFINEAWTSIEQPGVYRGQCAELCGKDHGFMPIVVEAVSKGLQQWLAQRKPAPPAAPATPAAPAEPAAPAGEAPAAPAAAEAAAHLPPQPAARDVKPAAARGRGDNRF
jgi:cytochrome c oxidase subunit 2